MIRIQNRLGFYSAAFEATRWFTETQNKKYNTDCKVIWLVKIKYTSTELIN